MVTTMNGASAVIEKVSQQSKGISSEPIAGEYCPLCGSRGAEVISCRATNNAGIRLCSCVGNGGVLLSWLWDSETEYADWYSHPSAYHETEQVLNGQKPYVEMQADHARASQSRAEILSILYPSHKYPRLIDVGCGDGMFVSMARIAGYQAKGMEPNADVLNHAPQSLVKDLSVGTWEEVSGEWDCICMHDVFEHLTRPQACLRHFYLLLSATGRLIIEMPEWNSPHQRESGFDWKHIRPRQHVCLYSFAAAIALFERNGFSLDSFYRPLQGNIGKAVWILKKEGNSC